ncbi:MAG: hypothetical protein NTX52_04215 [Planctomycetota bacterium]|nr:hypothetical protein [Planctomycetota bacterium]
MIKFQCAKCSHDFRVPSEYGGKKIRCKKCNHINLIPVAGVEKKNTDDLTKDVAQDFAEEYMDAFKALLKHEKEAPPIDT